MDHQGSTEGYKRIITSSVLPGGSQSNDSQKLTPSDSSTVFANNMLAEAVDLEEDSSMVTSNTFNFPTVTTKKASNKTLLCALLVVVCLLLVLLVAIAGVTLAAFNRISFQSSSDDIATLQQTSELNYTVLMQMTAQLFQQVSGNFDLVVQNISLLDEETNLAAQNQRGSIETLNITLLGLMLKLEELKMSLSVLQNNITYLQSVRETLDSRIDALANQTYTPPTCFPNIIESFSDGLSEASTNVVPLVSYYVTK